MSSVDSNHFNDAPAQHPRSLNLKIIALSMSVYIDTCWSTLKRSINTATRFGEIEIKELDVSHSVNSFEVVLTYSLKVESQLKTKTGRHDFAEGYIKCDDFPEFKQVVDHLVKLETGRDDVTKNLIKLVTDQPYASVSSGLLRTANARLYVHYGCKLCLAKGHTLCTNCDSSGSCRCGKCRGSGDRSCVCNGGYFSNLVQYHDSHGRLHSRTERVPCGYCNRSGRVKCESCRGRGYVECSVCNGKGHCTCNQCDGQGSLTDIATVCTYTDRSFTAVLPQDRNEFLERAIQKLGFGQLAKVGEIDLQKTLLMPNYGGVQFTYLARLESASLSVKANGHLMQWQMFGTPPTVLDSDGYAEKLLADDLRTLTDLCKPLPMLLPTFLSKVGSALRQFCASPEHNSLFLTAAHLPEAKDSASFLDHGLTQTYVSQSLRTARSAVIAATVWRNIFVSVSCAVATVAFFMFLRLPDWLPPQWGQICLSLAISSFGVAYSKISSKRWVDSMGNGGFAFWIKQGKNIESRLWFFVFFAASYFSGSYFQ